MKVCQKATYEQHCNQRTRWYKKCGDYTDLFFPSSCTFLAITEHVATKYNLPKRCNPDKNPLGTEMNMTKTDLPKRCNPDENPLGTEMNMTKTDSQESLGSSLPTPRNGLATGGAASYTVNCCVPVVSTICGSGGVFGSWWSFLVYCAGMEPASSITLLSSMAASLLAAGVLFPCLITASSVEEGQLNEEYSPNLLGSVIECCHPNHVGYRTARQPTETTRLNNHLSMV